MNGQQTEKKPYVRPVLKRIELKVDEVLNVCCKNDTCYSGGLPATGGVPSS